MRERVAEFVRPEERVWVAPGLALPASLSTCADASEAAVRIYPLDAVAAVNDDGAVFIGGPIDGTTVRLLRHLCGDQPARAVLLDGCTLRARRGAFEVVALAAGTSGRDLQTALSPLVLLAGPGLREL